ncbi:MAG: hypothetical protein MR029_01925 [Clostridium sp.]|nr:hypothetical protein [Clostridium sp.]
MYDFIFQEQWWVETIVSVIIAGSLSFAIATMKGEKDWEGIENSNARMEKQNSSILDRGESQTRLLSSEHKDLSSEHRDLSNEHRDLSSEHRDLSNEHRDLSNEHSELKSEIQKVIANQEKDKAVREACGKVMPEGDTFKRMADAVYMHSVQLQQEVTILNDKIAQLNKENHDQKLQIISLQDKIQKLKQQKVSKEQQNKKEPKSDYEDVINSMNISHDNLDDEEWER